MPKCKALTGSVKKGLNEHNEDDTFMRVDYCAQNQENLRKP